MGTIIQQIVVFVQLHWADIVAAYLSLIGFASIVVKLTPTLKDDDVLKSIIRFVGKYLALNRSSGTT